MPSEVNGLLGTFPAVNPVFRGGYVFSDHQIAGVVAANNFMALTNPTGSGRSILIAGVFISSTTTGAVGDPPPLRGYLATGVSGGTLESANTIAKVRSTMPNAVGEIRTDNPTATLGAAWFNSPAINTGAAATAPFVHQVPATIPAGSLTLLPGESTVLRTDSGDINQMWNLSIAWSEI
jgi:hypothetical protein